MSNIPNIVIDVPSSSNRATMRLLNKGVPVTLTDVSKMDLILPSGVIISSDDEPRVFDWITSMTKGVVYLFLGRLDHESPFDAGCVYECQLIVYDPLDVRGVFWGYIRVITV